ncbi:DDT domain-containing protein [Cynara cardunculus var. scolymus]|uniref:DDT domain-containing protein n=1 Tax=Cynara cardunculus var. scolymus TaxID=59895 RepID=A0A103Y5X7_CYNCS|nr:DDT domain-containing protein [Cynara cardunculus var. scolymus]
MKELMVKGLNMMLMMAWISMKMGWWMFQRSPFSWPLKHLEQLWVQFVFIFLKYEMETVNASYVIPFEYYKVQPFERFVSPQSPPSSGNFGVFEEHVSYLLSVYNFLHSFSVCLFLSPFGLDEFVGALNCSTPNALLDAIHVAPLYVNGANQSWRKKPTTAATFSTYINCCCIKLDHIMGSVDECPCGCNGVSVCSSRQSAVAEASGTGIDLQEKWTGLNFQNLEHPSGRHPSTYEDSGKQQMPLADVNLPNASAMSFRVGGATMKDKHKRNAGIQHDDKQSLDQI